MDFREVCRKLGEKDIEVFEANVPVVPALPTISSFWIEELLEHCPAL